MFKSLYSIFLMAVLMSCSTAIKIDSFKEPISESVYLDVPFYLQQGNMCGPVAVASLLSYYDKDFQMKNIENAIYNSNIGGTLAMDLPIYLRTYGLEASAFKGTLKDLKIMIDEGKPVIAHLDVGLSFYPKGHFVVVTGYSDKLNTLSMHYGVSSDKLMSYDKFLLQWKKTNYTAIGVVNN